MAVVVRNPYAGYGQFRKAQLHCHTTASDGRFAPTELLQMYRDAGYTFVCITDHNHVTDAPTLNSEEFLAIPGTEDTVSHVLDPLGPHMGRLFVKEPLRAGSAQERIDQTRAAGGVVSLCHPSWNGNLWTGAWTASTIAKLDGVHLMEIWNPHSKSDEDVRRWMAGLNAQGPGRGCWGVAVDDCHRESQFDRGWIMVQVSDISAASFRTALLSGAFYASTGLTAEFGLDGLTLMATIPEQGTIQFFDQEGHIRATVFGRTGTYTFRGNEGYVRVMAQAARAQAWSQPFWLEHLTSS